MTADSNMACSGLISLRETVQAASRALAGLDAEGLEEMAAALSALVRPLPLLARTLERTSVSEARAAVQDMAVFARVLEATRDNLHVMRRLQLLREGRLEYAAEARYGND